MLIKNAKNNHNSNNNSYNSNSNSYNNSNINSNRLEQIGCVEFTHTSDLWKHTEQINWKLLSTVTQEISFREDETMLAKDVQNDYLFYIKKGHAKVISENNNSNIVNIITEGSFFGEMSLLLNVKTTANIIAGTHVELLKIKFSLLFDLCKQDPQVCYG
jgi:signal-transduction protein with cAMP-binding, CBS, and nucleotidyltransferase domain